MARNNAVAILDFGSSTLNVMIAERGVNNNFNILARSEMEYKGYIDGEFIDTADLYSSLEHAINTVEQESRMKIGEIFVGVPGEFASVVVTEPSVTYPNKRKITKIEIEELYEKGCNFDTSSFTLINRSPIYYTIDNVSALIDPTGEITQRLKAQISYVFATNDFVELVYTILEQLGIKRNKVEFVSSCLAQSLYLLDDFERDRFAVLVDIGYTTTSVIISRGQGIIYLKTFPEGGAHITADLFQKLNFIELGIPFNYAEELKKKIVLSFAVNGEDYYEVNCNGYIEKFPRKQVHEIVDARLNEIAELVDACLKLCKVPFPTYIGLKLTGGGISYIRGAKEYVGQCLSKHIDLIKINNPKYDEPHLSSTYALLDLALEQRSKRSFFSKVFK